ncbi:hypothetical protein BBJ28_00017857 [Nothophytophthora sp. Chile5]|nr:hypothetical protein BBJ28_00017857 [Nothophytophthora sp. Chile5]
MSALQQQKRAEAAQLVQQADKALAKKAFFRAAPDFLSAAPLLEKAGELFRAGGDFEASKRAFTQAAAAQQRNQSPFRGAQNYENVAKTALQQLKDERAGANSAAQRTVEARKAYESASGLYVDMGELGKAADALVKGAAACEAHGMAVNDVLPLYMSACELLEAQDKPHFAVETFRKTLSFLAKHALYADALKLLDRMVTLFEAMDQRHNAHKCGLSQVVLLLASGDVPAADALYSRLLQDDAFLASDDCALAEDLVRAFKMGNEELLQTTVRKPGFLALDNQIGRICRKLSVYGTSLDAPPAVPAPPQQHRAAPSSSSSQQQPTKQRNPFAPSARAAPAQRNPFAPSAQAAPAQRNPFAPSTRAPEPTPMSFSTGENEYEMAESEAPTASSASLRDSEYEAALAAALGEVSMSKGEHEDEEKAAVPRAPEVQTVAAKSHAPVEAEAKASAPLSPQSPASLPSPPPVQADRSTRTDFEFDSLEFAMPDSDSLEFSMSMDDQLDAALGAGGYKDSFETTAAPAPKAEAPASASKPVPKAAPPVEDDMFDLT